MQKVNTPLTSEEQSILKYISPDLREQYAQQMFNGGMLAAYSLPGAEFYLDRISALRVPLEHTMLGIKNRNWAIADIGNDEEWQRTYDDRIVGRSVEFIVLDTGDPDHRDLQNTKTTVIRFPGEDHPDRNGHATAIGSYLGSENPATSGLYRHCVGSNPSVTVSYLGVLGAAGSGPREVLDDRLRDAIFMVGRNTDPHKLFIVNLSLGARAALPSSTSRLLYELRARGAVIVGAAGNDGREGVNMPASHEAVLATGAYDIDGRIATYSNWGKRVFHSAGGTLLYSAAPGNKYVAVSGTSMACPMAASVIAAAWFTRADVSDAASLISLLRGLYYDRGDRGSDVYYGLGSGKLSLLSDVVSGKKPYTIPNREITTHHDVNLLLEWSVAEGPSEGKVIITSLVLSLPSSQSVQDHFAQVSAKLNALSSPISVFISPPADFDYALSQWATALGHYLGGQVRSLTAEVDQLRIKISDPLPGRWRVTQQGNRLTVKKKSGCRYITTARIKV